MKIAIYNVTATTHFGGLETYGWEVGKALAARGHEVWIVAGEGGSARNDAVQLKTFKFTERGCFPNLGTRFRKLVERLSFAKNAVPWLVEQKFDAIIINKPFDMPALWWARRKGAKAVTVFRSGGTDFFQMDRFFAQAVDLWLSTSRYNAQQIEARYGREVTLVPNGVDVGRFAVGSHAIVASNTYLREQYLIPATAPLIVSVGRLIGWKGLHVIVEALVKVPEAHYLIIGKGDERARLEALAQQCGVTKRVHFAGVQQHADLPALLGAADIFVQPSIGEEAFGISVVEAMSCGLPAVVSRNGGMVEIVEDGATGYLLPPGDVNAWATTLAKLANDALLRQQLGQAARQHVEANFTWAANAEKLEFLIGRKVANKRIADD